MSLYDRDGRRIENETTSAPQGLSAYEIAKIQRAQAFAMFGYDPYQGGPPPPDWYTSQQKQNYYSNAIGIDPAEKGNRSPYHMALAEVRAAKAQTRDGLEEVTRAAPQQARHPSMEWDRGRERTRED